MNNKPNYKDIKKEDKVITTADIREWKKELEEAYIPSREYTIMKYCRHIGDLVSINIPFKEGDCEICFQETFGKAINNYFLK